ncbi:MGH1-like glycoside hydrolase domain-containing protein [Paenibacillus sp. FA6]|uniref:MGH1-like glycoside hydrolase domain-containing protein n=1 Tax=Paenibacillus sp. FA6 TaxID=3413029 RepID=UPI003F65C7AA
MQKSALLERLRSLSVESQIGELGKDSDHDVMKKWGAFNVSFVAESDKLELVYYQAIRKLLDCIVPTLDKEPILHEGGIYFGCWLESTGTINAELLSRFLPSVSEETYLSFAKYQREDGMLPYKITKDGPSYRQIQLVTPLARCVWNHYQLHGKNKLFLRTMYDAMIKYDDWLVQYRNTRETGCVEAFSAFDTGHDLSPRFWHVADTPHLNDPTQCNPNSPILPFLAPDLTANVYCQRLYIAKMAEELGEDGSQWDEKAQQSLKSLFQYCFDEEDYFFYDRDRNDQFVRVQSDVLLRVMACEVGNSKFFEEMLSKYLLNTRKFFAKYPYPSIALDDPRYDSHNSYNSWAGPSNFLSIIRTAHAFEHHHRYVELTWVMFPILAAMARMTRFSQALSPWTGEEGFTEVYSPAILAVLDYIERLSGILPTRDETLWFTGVLPYDVDHGEQITGDLAYRRKVDEQTFEFVNTSDGCQIYRNGELKLVFPAGIRVVTDRNGQLLSIIGMTLQPISGELKFDGLEISFTVKGNEQLDYRDGQLVTVRDIGIVHPTYE